MTYLLITLLTTSNIQYLKILYETIINQIDVNIDYDIVIIVNTLNKNYFKKVKKQFSNIKVIETKSNGKPGKGHNSILDYFKNNNKYDYLLPIDGDDFLYPSAISILEEFINKSYDVLFLGYSDKLSYEHNNCLHYNLLDKCYLFYNMKIMNMINSWKKGKISPFDNNINNCNTPGRLILCSRKAIEKLNLNYDENLKWYDDYILFLECFSECINSNKFKINVLETNDILLYNTLNLNSVSKKFKINNDLKKIKEEEIFRKSIENKFNNIRDWNLDKIKFIESSKNNLPIKDKIKYCEDIIKKLDLKSININQNMYNYFFKYGLENKIDDFIDLYKENFNNKEIKLNNINLNKVSKKIISNTSEVYIEKDLNYVLKKSNFKFQSYNCHEREINIYKLLNKLKKTTDKFSWCPIMYDYNNEYILLEYCGEIINKNNIPNDYKKQIKYIINDLNDINMKHNDCKICEVLVKNNNIYICDFGWVSINNDFSCGFNIDNRIKPHGIYPIGNIYNLIENELKYINCNRSITSNNSGSQSEIPNISISDNNLIISGYQHYNISFDGKITLKSKIEKYLIIQNILNKIKINNITKTNCNSIIDIGCSNGLTSIIASSLGYNVLSLDHDINCINLIKNIINKLNLQNIEAEQYSFGNKINKSGDIVIMLALIHWIYSCTSLFGNFDDIFKYIKPYINNYLLIEWIDTEDPAIKSFNHIDFNKKIQNQEYNKINFEDSLKKNIGNIIETIEVDGPTRILYIVENNVELVIPNNKIINNNIINNNIINDTNIKKLPKIYFVYKENMNVIEEYIDSLNIIEECIELDDINKYYNKDDIFIFGQMWLDIDSNKQLIENHNFIFLNVEMLSESTRFNHILKFLKNNITIIDYSKNNIDIMNSKIKELNINYSKKIFHLPYQFNKNENEILKNDEDKYEYDIGIINAITKVDKSNDDKLIYKRNIIWNLVQKENWKYINILGWGKERDKIISKCKIILNIPVLNIYNIYEYIRCDRLLFANKIIISDKSYKQDLLDIKDYVIWEDFDNIITKAKYVLENFDKFNIKKDLSKIIDNRKIELNNFKNIIYNENENDNIDDDGLSNYLLVTTTYKNNFTLMELFYKFYKKVWNPTNFLFIVGNTEEDKNKNIGIINDTLGIELILLHNIIFPKYPTVSNGTLYKYDNIYVYIYDTSLKYKTNFTWDRTRDFLLKNLHNGLESIGHPIFKHKYYINVDNDDLLYTQDPKYTLENNLNKFHTLEYIPVEKFNINNKMKFISCSYYYIHKSNNASLINNQHKFCRFINYKQPFGNCHHKMEEIHEKTDYETCHNFDINNITHCCYAFGCPSLEALVNEKHWQQTMFIDGKMSMSLDTTEEKIKEDFYKYYSYESLTEEEKNNIPIIDYSKSIIDNIKNDNIKKDNIDNINKYLVCILTSYSIDLLKISIQCALNQIYTNFDVYIIVNTLDETYFDKVLNLVKSNFKDKIQDVIKTESNGKPGKGHNSVIEVFKKSHYDYLIICDGDDFLYPTSISRINNLVKTNMYDVITLIGNPARISIKLLEYNENIKERIKTVKFQKSIMIEKGVDYLSSLSSEFNNTLATPCRLFFINKNTASKYNKLYDEDMYIYDDYKAFLNIYNQYIINENKICFLNDQYIYLYNNFNPISVSKNVGEKKKKQLYDLNIYQSYNIDNLNVEKINIFNNVEISDSEIKIIDHFETSIIDLYRQHYEKNHYNLYEYNKINSVNTEYITFIDNGTNWDYNSINNNSLRGTENAIYNLSSCLSCNNIVNVFTNGGIKHNLKHNLYYDNINNITNTKSSIIIFQGVPRINLENLNNIRKYIYQQHDITVQFIKKNYKNNIFDKYINKYIFVSNWQKNRYEQYYSLDKNKCVVIQNAINPKLELLLEKNITYKKELSLIYISSPYRGLNLIIPLFNKLLKKYPYLKLKIFSSLQLENKNKNFEPLDLNYLNKNIKNGDLIYKKLYEEFIEHSSIDYYASVPQHILFEHLKLSMILFYPNIFPETCCTSILEAMTCRCFVVSSDLGALKETSNNFAFLYDPCIDVNHYNIKVEDFINNPYYFTINDLSNNYINNMIDKTSELLQNYNTKECQNYLDLQQEYIKNNCLWIHKKQQFDFI
tara:strand:+ start:5379 stop:11732 length:6354 start_codon:yes stop_codon:yes gene_type:complete